MKKGLRLFLLYLYRGNDELPIGLRHMCKDVVSDLTFSEERYCRGLRDSKDKGDGDFNLFWKCFREWKEKNVMPEEEQLEVMERLEHLIEIRVDGIMGANRRNYYGECAAFIIRRPETHDYRVCNGTDDENKACRRIFRN